MDLRSLKYFVSAVEVGSITGASDACFVAQPSITHAISQLEAEFETTFLIRSRKGVTCTPKGDAFYHKAKALLVHADMVKQSVQETEHKVYALYVCPTVHSITLQHAIKKLMADDEGVQWTLVSRPEEADFWLESSPSKSTNQAPVDAFITEHYYLMASDAHPLHQLLENKGSLSLRQLMDYPWIERSHCSYKSDFYTLLQTAGVFEEIQFNAHVDNDDRALSFVQANMGITFAPFFNVSGSKLAGLEGIKAIELSRIEGAPALSRVLMLRKNKALINACERA